jgi:hypothetical protein
LKSSLPFHSIIIAITAFGAVTVLACTTEESRSEGPTLAGPGVPAEPQVTQTTNENPGNAAPKGSKCEELGSLSATALPAILDTKASPDNQFTGFTLPNRPVRSKAKVLAIGAVSDLQGKALALGADINNSWKTCTACVLISIGCATDTDCAGAAFFFPRRGTATFSALASKSGQPFSGTLEDVELEQVTIDPKTLVSTPVVNGACMHLSSLTFASTTKSTLTVVDAGTSSGTSGTSGTSGNSGTSGTSGTTSTSSASSASSSGTSEENDGKSSTSSGGQQI